MAGQPYIKTEALWEEYFRAALGKSDAEAVEALMRIKEAEPENPEVALKLGDHLMRKGDPEGALIAYHDSAQALLQNGATQRALAVYKLILQASPEDAIAIERSNAILEEIRQGIPNRPMTSPHAPEDASGPPAGQAEAGLSLESADFTAHADIKVPAIFTSLSQEDFLMLCGAATFRSYENGETVIREDEPGDSIYAIQRGKALVTTGYRGQDLAIASLSEGDFFGEMALLSKRPRTATVTAFGVLEVMEITKDTLKAVCEKQPGIVKSLVEFYSTRARDSREKLLRGGVKPSASQY